MPEEISKLVISIIVIFLLILFVTALVKMFTQNTEYQQAKASIADIEELANTLAKADVKSYLVESPKDWAILNNPSSGQFCICKRYKPSTIDLKDPREEQIASCDLRGVCLKQDIGVSGICNPGSAISLENCLYIETLPLKITLSKDYAGQIVVSTKESPFTDEVLSDSLYKNSFNTLKEDAAFKALLLDYLSSNLDLNKENNLKNYLSNLNFIKAANLEGKYWELDYWMPGKTTKELYQNVKGTALYPFKHTDVSYALGIITVDSDKYNIQMRLGEYSPLNSRQLSDKMIAIQNSIYNSPSTFFIPEEVMGTSSNQLVTSKLESLESFSFVNEFDIGWKVFVKEVQSEKDVSTLNNELILNYLYSGYDYFQRDSSILENVLGYPLDSNNLVSIFYTGLSNSNSAESNQYMSFPAVNYFEYKGKKYVFALSLIADNSID